MIIDEALASPVHRPDHQRQDRQRPARASVVLALHRPDFSRPAVRVPAIRLTGAGGRRLEPDGPQPDVGSGWAAPAAAPGGRSPRRALRGAEGRAWLAGAQHTKPSPRARCASGGPASASVSAPEVTGPSEPD